MQTMKTEEAYTMLGLSPDAGESERHDAFRRMQTRLEEKIAKAPTPGLKEKYRASLLKLEQAIEVIELSADGGDLPMLRPDYEAPDVSSSVPVQTPTADHAATPQQATPAKPPIPSKSTPSSGSNKKEIMISIFVVILLIGAGAGWWFGYETPRRAEADRLVARAQQLEEKGKLDEAVGVLEKALSVKSGWKPAIEVLDRVQNELDRIESETKRNQERQAADQSRDLDRLLVAARLAQTQEKWVDALAGFQKAARVDPQNTEANEAVARLEKLLANARGGVVVKSEPGGATVRLGGRGEDLTPANYIDLKLGSYEVEVEKLGYDIIKKEVLVRKDKTTVVGPLRLNRSEGSLMVKSEPEGMAFTVKRVSSDVSSDKAFEGRRGSTPAVLSDLPTGIYQVSMKRTGWPVYRRNVAVKRDVKTPVAWAFSQGGVSLTSSPTGSEVFQLVSGQLKKIGTTPLQLNSLPVGGYTFVIKRDGWSDLRKTVQVSKGEAAQFHGEFASGMLTITSNPAGCAYQIKIKNSKVSQLTQDLNAAQKEYKIKGLSAQRNRYLKQRIAQLQAAIVQKESSVSSAFRGSTPAASVHLPVADYEVVLSRPGWSDVRQTVSIIKGQTQEIKADFPGGDVALVSEPAGALIKTASGALIGKTPFRGELPTGGRTVHLSLKGYQSKQVKLDVKASEKTSKTVSLEKVKVAPKMPSGTFSGSVTFNFADGRKLVSYRTVTVGSDQSKVTLSSSDYFTSNPGKKYQSKITVYGKFSGRIFSSSRQSAQSTDYQKWLSESMRLKFSSNGKSLSLSASFREQGRLVSGSGTLSR